jgi:hypothetical protein
MARFIMWIWLVFPWIAFASQDAEKNGYLLNRPFSWNTAPVPVKDEERGEIKIAFWNIQIQWMDTAQYPQYHWSKRKKPVIQLIQNDRPDILGLCEFNSVQAADLKEAFQKEGYCLVGFSSETLKSIEEIDEILNLGDKPRYGEFVGFLFNEKRCQLLQLERFPLEKGIKHNRILVIGYFWDRIACFPFAVLCSHFDHRSQISRHKSAELELAFIEDFERRGIPWFSLSDRNWYPDKSGQEEAEMYANKSYICDFRDETVQGHFGPSGTFAGYLGLESNKDRPVITLNEGKQAILASSVDVGFRSRSKICALNSYSYTGEFDPDTYELFPQDQSGDVSQRNFASDHYYMGGTFLLRP